MSRFGLSAAEQYELLTRDAAGVVPADELMDKLERAVADDRPLRVKLGLDPTAADVTLGWAVMLRKLRQFQDLGHTAVLIVGGFTAQVGDPSGKSDTRPRLTAEAVRAYAERLLEQFWRVLDPARTEVRDNAEWLAPLGMEDILRLTAVATVARMLERDDFAKRFAAGRPISVMELLYPLLQGRDSVAVRADVELGGTDQTFNLLMGRDVQRDAGQEPQVALTMPLLVGLDGSAKMSQSLGNYVGVAEPAEEMFGKLMSIPDGLIADYLGLCAGAPPAEVAEVRAGLADGTRHPNAEKRRMARLVVDLYHGTGAGEDSEARFDLVHRRHEIPGDVPDVPLPSTLAGQGRVWLPRLLVELGLAGSNSDARRRIEQGGVRLDGERVSDPGLELAPAELVGRVVQVGTHRFVRIASPGERG